MANIPQLWYTVEFQPGVVYKLSNVPPFNECTVRFSCDQHIKTFRARCTFEDEERGKDKGYLIVELTNRNANTEITFTIDSILAMTSGEGQYTISLYVENDEGIWNEYSFLLTTEQDSSHLYVIDNNNNYVVMRDND